MAEYIDRMELLKQVAHRSASELDVWDTWGIRNVINFIPAADVVEVVRCRECTMADDCSDEREMYCTLYHKYRPCDYFCADGERKKDKERKILEDAGVLFPVETNIYDEVETHYNCTVQVLRNSITGETSIGWWEEE